MGTGAGVAETLMWEVRCEPGRSKALVEWIRAEVLPLFWEDEAIALWNLYRSTTQQSAAARSDASTTQQSAAARSDASTTQQSAAARSDAPKAQQDGGDRVVLIVDYVGRASAAAPLPTPPADLVARPAHQWVFERLDM